MTSLHFRDASVWCGRNIRHKPIHDRVAAGPHIGPRGTLVGEIISRGRFHHARHAVRTPDSVRIEPQISPIAAQAAHLVADECHDHAVRKSRSACEQRVVQSDACDRYEPCGDAPGSLLYADYLDRQNRRHPIYEAGDRAQKPAEPQAGTEPSKKQPKPAPVDTGLGPKLGDIPGPEAGARTHQRVQMAYQVQRYSPAGSLVDVTL